MHREERGRARAVDGDGGAVDVEREGDAARGGAARGADLAIHVEVARGALEHPLAVVAGEEPDEDPAARAVDLRGAHARVFDRVPRDLEQVALLRVHERRLAGRHPEEARVEAREVRDEAPLAGHDATLHARPRVVESRDRKPIGRHLAEAALALVQHAPEGLEVGGAGQPARHPYHRDGFALR